MGAPGYVTTVVSGFADGIAFAIALYRIHGSWYANLDRDLHNASPLKGDREREPLACLQAAAQVGKHDVCRRALTRDCFDRPFLLLIFQAKQRLAF